MAELSKSLKFVIGILLAANILTAVARDSDMAGRYTTTYTIKENKDGTCRLLSQVQIERTYLSERSAEINHFDIHEPSYTNISKIKGFFRGKHLKKNRITFQFADSEDQFISEYKIHTLFFPDDMKPGEKLSYEYEESYRDIAFLPIIFVPNSEYLKFYRIVFEHPRDYTVDFQFFFPRDTIKYAIENSSEKETVLSFRDIEEKKAIDYFPFNDFHAAVLVSVRKNGREINPVSVPEFAKWYSAQISLKPAVADTAMALFPEVFSGDTSDMEKLKSIHDLVRRKIRYIADEQSMHSFIPHSPDYTLKKSYGDCKDRAYLASALAAGENLKVSMAVVSTHPKPSFNGVHVLQYNHVICMAEMENGETLFFDPTSKYCEFGNLPEDDIGAKALVLDPENPRIVKVGAPNDSASISVTLKGEIGNLRQCQAEIVLRNDPFSATLQAREELTGASLENFLAELVGSNFYKISFDHFQPAREKENALVFTATADLSKFIVASTTRRYIPKLPFLAADKDLLERSEDPYPVYLPTRRRISLSIDLEVPGAVVEDEMYRLGEDSTGTCSASLMRMADDQIRINYEIRQVSKYLDGNAKTRFLEFCSDYLKSKNQMFILAGSEL